MTVAPFIEVRELRRSFDVSKPWVARLINREPRRILQAVDGVSFGINRGETLGIVGESGSGKSTLAHMLVGLLHPNAGQVRIDGVDVTTDNRAARRDLRRRIQMIFQDPYASRDPRWRVGATIAEPIQALSRPQDQTTISARVAELLRLVGLDPADGRKFPHEFSGGQRQRIAIARALASTPEFIVCDEPTSALDVSVQAQILNLMRDLQDRLRLTYLLITHNLAVVRHMATHVGVMYLGRIVELAPMRALFAAPRHPYTRMLLDAVPDLDLSGRPRTPIQGEPPNPIEPPLGCAFHARCPEVVDRCRVEAPELRNGVACHLAPGVLATPVKRTARASEFGDSLVPSPLLLRGGRPPLPSHVR
jgi:peptide/nickel transport system ATP-binding protein